MSKYDTQAEEFLKEHDLTLSTHYVDTVINPWGKGPYGDSYNDKYRITIRRKDSGKAFTFNFFNSMNAHMKNERPTAYDALACLSAESYEPYGDKWGFFNEFGYEPNKENEALYYRVKRFAKRINKFFTEDELEPLREIN